MTISAERAEELESEIERTNEEEQNRERKKIPTWNRKIQTSNTGFRRIFDRAKAMAGGGLLLFEFRRANAEKKIGEDDPSFTVFFEDAEALGRVIGVSPTRTHPSGPLQIIMTRRCLVRNVRLLRSDGNEDIWIVGIGGSIGPVDDLGPVDALTSHRIEALSRAA